MLGGRGAKGKAATRVASLSALSASLYRPLKTAGAYYLAAIRAVFHPVGFPGRTASIRTISVIVDDIGCLCGASHFRRRGMTFDGSAAIATFDCQMQRLFTGRARVPRRPVGGEDRRCGLALGAGCQRTTRSSHVFVACAVSWTLRPRRAALGSCERL
jgi:hypothetical protein